MHQSPLTALRSPALPAFVGQAGVDLRRESIRISVSDVDPSREAAHPATVHSSSPSGSPRDHSPGDSDSPIPRARRSGILSVVSSRIRANPFPPSPVARTNYSSRICPAGSEYRDDQANLPQPEDASGGVLSRE